MNLIFESKNRVREPPDLYCIEGNEQVVLSCPCCRPEIEIDDLHQYFRQKEQKRIEEENRKREEQRLAEQKRIEEEQKGTAKNLKRRSA